jgi:signal transduction histidine kinase
LKSSDAHNIKPAKTKQGYLLKERIYIAASLIASIASLVGLGINLAIDLPTGFNIYVFILSLCFATLFYFARFNNKFYPHILVSLGIIGLSISWFSEGGFNGPILPLFIIAMIVFTAISHKKHHIAYLLFLLVNIIVLYAIQESEYSKYILQYANETDRNIDVVTTLTIGLVASYLFVAFIRQSFINLHEKTLRQKEELTELNAMKDKFFSIIAHDLRAPFNGFISLTEVMSNTEMKLDKEELQGLSLKLNKTAKSTHTLLEDLLTWAKTQQGLIPYQPQTIALREFTHNYLAVMQDLADNKNISTFNNIPNNIEIKADKDMLLNIFNNLIVNAIKFTPNGGSIIIEASEQDSKTIEILVVDNGIGMNSKTLEHLFSLTKQIRHLGTNNEPSSGLGLLLCKGFIEQNNGEISVESQLGKGSTFKFTLPKA